MKVAVSASGAGLDAAVDPRFGRCPYFIIVDTDSMQFESVPNASQYAPMGAGIQAAQTIAGKGARVILTGNVGPNAYQALSAAGIQIITGVAGAVREVVTKYKRGELRSSFASNVPMGYGMGGGFGMGMGRGRGMGRGMGKFAQPYMGVPSSTVPPTPQISKEQEAQMLRSQINLLQNQLEQIKKRLRELERKK